MKVYPNYTYLWGILTPILFDFFFSSFFFYISNQSGFGLLIYHNVTRLLSFTLNDNILLCYLLKCLVGALEPKQLNITGNLHRFYLFLFHAFYINTVVIVLFFSSNFVSQFLYFGILFCLKRKRNPPDNMLRNRFPPLKPILWLLNLKPEPKMSKLMLTIGPYPPTTD